MNKTILITGATSGIGKATAMALAGKGATLSLLVRNVDKAEKTKQEIIAATGNKNIDIQLIDLADLSSVRKAAEALKIKFKQIDILINNAGGIFKQRAETVDGFEMTFALNHLGHFLLTNLLLENLKTSPQARIINISSSAHYPGKINFDDLMAKNKYSSFKAYSQAKLANILFTKELVARLKDSNISVFALHPGVVNTGFGSDFTGVMKALLSLGQPLMIDATKGAKTTVYLATEANIENLSGKYFKKCKVTKPSAAAENPEIAKRLWQVSEKLTGLI
jgi:NAD(P)-dependent dehydrogenase (short-subunit alcohol dehydrogenase family)